MIDEKTKDTGFVIICYINGYFGYGDFHLLLFIRNNRFVKGIKIIIVSNL